MLMEKVHIVANKDQNCDLRIDKRNVRRVGSDRFGRK